jgi:methylmalonyl-CoA mutase cobalamin-binding domain/chain
MTDPQGILARTRTFAETHGRRPRIYLTFIDDVGVDRMLKALASQFADAGFNVDINTRCQSPEHLARSAVENDVHCVGLTGITARHQPLLQRLLDAMESEGGGDIVVALWTVADRPEGGQPTEENILVFSENATDTVYTETLLEHLFRTVPTALR